MIVEGGLFLLARRKPGGELGGLWEFPGGKLEPGEGDEEALVREFREEFLSALEVHDLIGETSFVHRGRKRALAAWSCSLPAKASLTLTEHAEWRWFGFSEIEGLALVESDRKLLPCIRAWWATFSPQS